MNANFETIIIAHRGHGPTSLLSGGDGNVVPPNIMPENTLKAFREAIRQGADGIEFDVHLTKDGHIVVIHDDELNKNVEGADRNTRELGLISEKTLAEVKTFNVGQNELIPTLRETLDLFVEANKKRQAKGFPPLIINAELKGENSTVETGKIINEYIDDGRLDVENFIFCSFKHNELIAIREINPLFRVSPSLKTGMLFGKENLVMPGWNVRGGAEYDPESLEKLRGYARESQCVALDPVLWDIYEPLVTLAKEEGLELHVSTSDIRTFERRHLVILLAIEQSGVPVFFKTDEPALARQTLTELRNLRDAALRTPIDYVPEMSTIPNTQVMVQPEPCNLMAGRQNRDNGASILTDVRNALKRPLENRPPNYSEIFATADHS